MFNALVDASDGPLQYSSGTDEDLKKLETRSNDAAYLVGKACHRLYDEEDWWKKGSTPVN